MKIEITSSQHSVQNTLLPTMEKEVAQPNNKGPITKELMISNIHKTKLQRLHQSMSNFLGKRGVITISTTIKFPHEDSSNSFKKMNVLVPSRVGASPNENLEVNLRTIILSMNSICSITIGLSRIKDHVEADC